MPNFQSTDPIESYLGAIPWSEYVGATFSFAGLRQDRAIKNLAFRLVFRTGMPANWDFADDIDELVVRRGWIGIAGLPETFTSLRRSSLNVCGEDLLFVRDEGVSYVWSHMMSGRRASTAIGWRARTLNGLGENLSLCLGHERFSLLDARLRVAGKRSFSGWTNLAAFLGEGEEPLGLGENANATAEFLAPLYARMEQHTSLSTGGTLSAFVTRRETAASRRALRLFVDVPGSAETKELSLQHDAGEDLWKGSLALPPTVNTAHLTLIWGRSGR